MSTQPDSDFGALLARYREAKNLTQDALADLTGGKVSVDTISALERGVHRSPQQATFELLAEALELSPEECTQFQAAARRGQARRGSSPPLNIPPRLVQAEEGKAPEEPGLAHSTLGTRVPDLAELPQPPRPTGLVGRDDDLHWLEDCIQRSPDGGIWSISGLGGSGKTALVARYISVRHHQFPGGVVVLYLSGVLEAESILRRLIEKLVPHGGELLSHELVTTSSLRSILADELSKRTRMGQAILIVLDNVEPGLIPVLRLLLDALHIGRAQVIVTSRDRLPALLVSGSRTLTRLAAPHASHLFTTLVPHLARTFLTPDEQAQVQYICQEICTGQALALVLAAKDLASHPWESLFTFRSRLEQPYALFGLIDDDGQPGILRVFASSYAALQPSTQRLLVALSAFPSRSLPDGLIRSLGAALGQSEAQINAHLAVLLQKYLIDHFPQSGNPPRFGMHPLVRQFASALFDRWEEAEKDRIYQAAIHWYQPWIMQLSQQIYSREGDSTNDQTFVEALQADDASIHAVLRWLASRIPETDQQLVALLYPLRRYWWALRRIEQGGSSTTVREQGIYWMTIGEAAAQRLGDDWKRAQAGMAFVLGLMTFRRSANEAIGYYQRSLILFRDLHEQQAIAVTLQNLGEAVQRAGDHHQAEVYFHESFALHRQLQDQKGVANALLALGDVAKRTGDTTRAYRLYRQSLTICQKISYRWGQAVLLRMLGDIALRRGQLDQAKKWYEASLPLRREVHDLRGEGITLRALGDVFLLQRKFEQAQQWYQNSLDVRQASADKQGEAITLKALGDLALAQGRLEEAKDLYGKSLELCSSVNEARGEEKALQGLGEIAQQRGQHEEALKHYEAALDIARRIHDSVGEADVLFRLGKLALKQSHVAQAMEYLREAHILAHAAETRLNELEIIEELGSLSERLHLSEAEEWYQKGLALAQSLSDQQAEQRLKAALQRAQGQ